MKISDVEFQGDGSKATFYYTAEGRVDFRQLIKDMAKAFSVRIEMRQIGFRQEAARLGGIGSCGRELCCSTWLTDFRSVSTSAARYQQLSLNPQKLAGQCGKLKCCLNFELDTYLDALQDFPRTDVKLHTQRGMASCQKIDIFKRLMWFTYDENPITWHKLSVDSVKEIIELNKEGEPIEELEEYAIVTDLSSRKSTSAYEGIELAPVEEDSITRFDAPKRKKNKHNNKKASNNNSKPQRDNRTQQAQSQPQGQSNKKKQSPKPKNNGNNNNPNANNNPNTAKKKSNNKNNKPKASNADKPKNENA
jgi:spumavirus gag protein